MIRVVSWPMNHCQSNPYIDLYFQALEQHGIRYLGNLPINNEALFARAGEFDVLHLHWGIENIWRERGPDLRHRLRGLVGLWRFLRLVRKLGVRLLWTVHDIEHHEGATLVDHIGYRLLAHHADLCLFHEETARQLFLRRYGVRPLKTLFFRLGNYDGVYPVAAPRVDIFRRLDLDPNRRTLLCQGVIRPYKGFDLAVAALKLLGPDYQLVVAGKPLDPLWGDQLRRLARGQKNVRFLFDLIDVQTLADLYAACDGVLLPYRRITGSGALLTALTLGRGVIASDLPFFRTTLDRRPGSGIMFPVGDIAELAKAISLFFHRDPRDRGYRARALADEFAWPTIVRPVVEWLESTLPQHPREQAHHDLHELETVY